MSARALALHWSVDGPLGLALGLLLVATGFLYLVAARRGTRRDRRRRPWPRHRTALFLGGLAVLSIDLYSGIGSGADVRLSIHMVQHMVMWVVVAPLLAAGAPIRLAFFALPRTERRGLAAWLHGRTVRVLAGPVGSVALFAIVVLVTHLPSVYGLALQREYVHVAEHGIYLLTGVLVWATVLGADPLPHRLRARGQLGCLAACMVPMLLVGEWLAVAPAPVYSHYVGTLGASALDDQRVAAAIMWAGCLPVCAIPALGRLSTRGRGRPGKGARAPTAPAAVRPVRP